MKSMTKTRGCGCGGKSTGGCGCKTSPATGTDIATVCAPCEDSAFVRPQFFAGQLLTEDDLTALEAYVVGKNRLHNSKLFGDGVVCGLVVSCGPCGGTTVTVGPGYALDCCGNDLVLTCDREIDLKPLITELRDQKQGKGACGSPCDPPDAQGSTNQPAATPVDVEYCLYLRYNETASDPIASYPNADDCDAQCQPTRVREGVSFELRCPEDPVRDDIVTHLEACLGRLSSPDRVTRDARSFEVYSAQAARAQPLVDKPLDRLETAETERWTARRKDLDAVADFATSNRTATADDLAAWTELLIDVGGLYIRQRSPQELETGKNNDSNDAIAFDFMSKKLSDDAELKKISSPLEQITSAEAAKMYNVASDGFSPQGSYAYSQRLFYRGALLTQKMRAPYANIAHDLRASLLQALSCDGGQTSDCTLYDDIRNLQLPSTQQLERDVEAGEVVDYALWGRKLSNLIRRFFMDCICRAFNPPCRSCDDTAVLLACVKVRGCQVVEVCNMARTYVLSPTAIRYWVPPISWIGDLLAKLCCPSDTCGDDITHANTDSKSRFISEMLRDPSPESAALVLPAFYRSGAYLPALASAGRSFSDLAVRKLLPGTSLRTSAMRTVAAVSSEPTNEVAAMRAHMAELTARMEAIEARTKKVTK